LELQAQIDTTDKEIDLMVYELYGLSDDKVALVEGQLMASWTNYCKIWFLFKIN